MQDTPDPVVEDRPRGEVITTSPQEGEFAHPKDYTPKDDAEKYARGVTLGNPGRLGRTAATEGERMWKSKEFVSYRQSATGESYAKGDEIPLAEAVRQGQVNPDGSEVVPRRTRVRIPRTTCMKCRGLGHGHGHNHRTDCHCPICTKPCSECAGTGMVSKKEATSGATA